jgi:hypothetical protein
VALDRAVDGLPTAEQRRLGVPVDMVLHLCRRSVAPTPASATDRTGRGDRCPIGDGAQVLG